MTTPRTLNIGCGSIYRADAINVDLYADRVDVRHDLNNLPYPFENDSFDVILCHNIIEHLDDVIAIMEEIHRIGSDGCVVHIRVPHFRSASLYEDVTHRHGFAWRSFDVFIEGGSIYGCYSPARFRMRHRAYTPYLVPLLYRLLSRIPVLTDNLLSKYIPMASISFELEVDKSPSGKRRDGGG